MTFKFTFLDAGREPQCVPDPRYPNGIDLDLSSGKPGCCFNTPYPAPRCGTMVAECETCGIRVTFTVAGRIDDPRTLKLACRKGVE
jgi:hypothetical protein